ncbi:MAG: sigma-70 family RNA polymerase sigma factor [Balneolaceae bacterium]|nr:sigma-70 family RNA polymerase sigma factor [Balneolaceae bacterium]
MRGDKITTLLKKHASGDGDAMGELMPLVYHEMQKMAHGRLKNEKAGHPMNTTDLVHEAYLKLVEFDRIDWQNRYHFYGIASTVMRNILVDFAVQQKAQKRGGDLQKVTLDEPIQASKVNLHDIVTIHHLLKKLEKIDERQVKVVECRFFGGLTIEETAKALDISTPTVSRDWSMARAWLNRELSYGV